MKKLISIFLIVLSISVFAGQSIKSLNKKLKNVDWKISVIENKLKRIDSALIIIDKKKDIVGWIFKDNKSAKVKPMSLMPTNKKYKKYIKIVYKTKEQKRKEIKEAYIKELIALNGQKKSILSEIVKIKNVENRTQRV